MVLLFFTVLPASADETYSAPFVQELKGFGNRLFDESRDFATSPFTLKDDNLFWALGIAGAIGLTYGFDTEIRDTIQKNRSKGVDKAADAGSFIGDPFLHLGVAALVYGGGILAESPRWQETGEMLGEALFLTDAAILTLKEATGRGRPNVTVDKGDFRPFAFRSGYDGFPSMHTGSSFAVAAVLARRSESVSVAVISYSAAVLVAFSRLNQDKHWASDLLAGAAIGELSGRVVTSFHASKRKEQRITFLPVVTGSGASMNMIYRF
jgi:membrane-associated phospholipid phosphatase